jgi:hypothetical protein
VNVDASQETAQRIARIVSATAAWLDEQYIQLGKKTIPLFNEVDDAFKALTDEDRAFLRSADLARRGASQ